MDRGVFKWLAAIAALLLCAFAHAPAFARDGQVAQCVSSLTTALSPEEIVNNARLLRCDELSPHISLPQSVVRFDLNDPADRSARLLQTRIGHFESLTVAVLDRDGRIVTRNYGMDDAVLASGEPMFQIDLPQVDETSRAIFAIFDQPRHDATMLRATLYDSDPTLGGDHFSLMLLFGMLVGLMLTPILFDIAFWMALKKHFLLWHAALVMSFSALVFFRTGLAVEFFSMTIESWRVALIVSLGFAAMMASMFSYSFIEEDRLHPWLRKALPYVGVWGLVSSIIHACSFDILAPLGGAFHTYALFPVLALLIAVLIDAMRRGSRAVLFQAVGWVPLLAAFTVQTVSFALPIGIPTDALPLFYIGVLSETSVTAIGVADRFIALRRERDHALLIADKMGTLSNKDPMTGLMNRRALANRFQELQRKGFTTFALLDLDDFKQVNDRFGHAVGDEVLRSVGEALNSEPGRNSAAFRMGGEEFLILLRGANGLERAETLRRAITRRVAADVVGLERVVTASMGVILSPAEALVPMKMDELYSRADTLLYEAKAAGRNRSVHERLTLFADKPDEETEVQAA